MRNLLPLFGQLVQQALGLARQAARTADVAAYSNQHDDGTSGDECEDDEDLRDLFFYPDLRDGRLFGYLVGKRLFGYFNCPSCFAKWRSAYSLADTGQQCRRCHANVYPYKQV
jgi:hypothetical protein